MRLKEERMVSKEEVKIEKEVKVSKEEVKIERINKIKEQENEVIKTLKDSKYENLVSDCYKEMDVNVEMVLQGLSYGAIFCGKGGLGKTHRCITMVAKKLDTKEFAYLDSFSTPTSLFVYFWENREKEVIILDDVSGMLENNKILSLLKSALWHLPNGKRVISYNTTKPLEDEMGRLVPRQFEFSSRLIILTNYIDKENPHLKAVLSRINKIDVNVPRKDLLELLNEIVQKDYRDLNITERKEVLNFLIEKTNQMSEDLNIRTLLRMFDYKCWARNNKKGDAWQTLCSTLLKRDERLVIVEKLQTDESLKTEDERIAKFEELTGGSRATYFRLKKTIKTNKPELKKPQAIPIA